MFKKAILLDQHFAQHKLADIYLLAATLLLCFFWFSYPPTIDFLMPDSASYIDFHSYRGAAYPAFLNIVDTFNFNVSLVQHSLFSISLLVLCIQFNRRYASITFTLLLLLGIGLNPSIIRFNFSVLTESFYFSCLFFLLAALIGISYKNSKSRLLLIGALFSLLVLIKPVSWAFICIPVIIIVQQLLLFKQNKANISPTSTTALYLIISFLVVWFLGSAYRYQHHQQISAGSFFGNQLIGKLVFTTFDPQRTPYPEAGQHWLDITNNSIKARKYLDADYQRFLFALNTYDYLRFRRMPEIVSLMNLEQPKTTQGEALSNMAIAVIKQNPQSYAYDVYLNWVNLWLLGEIQPYNRAVRYNQQLDSIPAQLRAKIPAPYRLSEDKSALRLLIKVFCLSALIINVAIIVFCLIRYILRLKALPECLYALFIICCASQAYYLLTALLQAALTRYALVAWPLHLITVLLVLKWLTARKTLT